MKAAATRKPATRKPVMNADIYAKQLFKEDAATSLQTVDKKEFLKLMSELVCLMPDAKHKYHYLVIAKNEDGTSSYIVTNGFRMRVVTSKLNLFGDSVTEVRMALSKSQIDMFIRTVRAGDAKTFQTYRRHGHFGVLCGDKSYLSEFSIPDYNYKVIMKVVKDFAEDKTAEITFDVKAFLDAIAVPFQTDNATVTDTRKVDNIQFTGEFQTLYLNSNPSINLTIQQNNQTPQPFRASKACKSGTTFASMAKRSFHMVYGEGCVHFDAIDYETVACMRFTLPCNINIQGTGFSQFGFNHLKDVLKTASYKGTSAQITRLKNKLFLIKPVGNDSVIDIVKEYQTFIPKNI